MYLHTGEIFRHFRCGGAERARVTDHQLAEVVNSIITGSTTQALKRRGTTSKAAVTSSPSFDSRVPPQAGQAHGAGTTRRSRGRCSAKGFLAGRSRGEVVDSPTVLPPFRPPDHPRCAGFELLELQPQLVEKPPAALGMRTEKAPV